MMLVTFDESMSVRPMFEKSPTTLARNDAVLMPDQSPNPLVTRCLPTVLSKVTMVGGSVE